MPVVWMTQGPFADRWMSVTWADADIARDNFWATFRCIDGQITPAERQTLMSAYVPATHQPSLDSWLTRSHVNTYDPFAAAVGAGAAPTAVAISPNTIAATAATGTTVGELSATDADTNDLHVFTTTDTKFRIGGPNGTTVYRAGGANPSTGAYSMQITVTDSRGATFSGNASITVT